MRSNTHNYLLTAASAVALLICPALRANQSITLTSTPYTYLTYSVGPYTADITPSPGSLLVFCMDGNKTYVNTTGTLYAFNDNTVGGFQNLPGQAVLDTQEEEVAFLAAYDGYLDPTHTHIATDEGPIQLAIWYIMGTLPSGATVSATQNTAAWAYVTQAQSIVTHNPTLFSTTAATGFMSTVQVWMPTNYPTTPNQRFITMGTLTPQIITTLTATPEPGTMVFLGTGVLLMALS